MNWEVGWDNLLEEGLNKGRYGEKGGISSRLSWLEELVDKTKANGDIELKLVYSNISGLLAKVFVLWISWYRTATTMFMRWVGRIKGLAWVIWEVGVMMVGTVNMEESGFDFRDLGCWMTRRRPTRRMRKKEGKYRRDIAKNTSAPEDRPSDGISWKVGKAAFVCNAWRNRGKMAINLV